MSTLLEQYPAGMMILALSAVVVLSAVCTAVLLKIKGAKRLPG